MSSLGASNGLDLINPLAVHFVSDIRETIRSSAFLHTFHDVFLEATASSYQFHSISPILIDNDDIVTVSFQTSHGIGLEHIAHQM
jgi:hypothetical protein